ncbi:MAG: hypothetical protein EBZ05_09100, partial [Verrucomicrobia bacterium]|nr:hypothetical protein [Verrucomicrobiota bacterium]
MGGGTSGNYQVELTAPFPILENRVRWALFCDGGFVNENVFDFAPKTYNTSQTMMVNGVETAPFQAVNGGFQIGVGVGIRMDIGIGPMKLDIGFPVMTGDPGNGGGLGAFPMKFIPTYLRLAAFALGITSLLSLGVQAQDFSKIAVIDYNTLLKEYYKAKDSQKQMEDLAANYQKERNERDAGLKSLV